MQISLLSKQNDFQIELQKLQCQNHDLDDELSRLQILYDENVEKLSSKDHKESELVEKLDKSASLVSALEVENQRLLKECEECRLVIQEKEKEVLETNEQYEQEKMEFESTKKQYEEIVRQLEQKESIKNEIKGTLSNSESAQPKRNHSTIEIGIETPSTVIESHLIAKLQTEVLELKWNNNLLQNLLKDERHQLEKLKLDNSMEKNQPLFTNQRINQETSKSSNVLERIRQLEMEVFGLKGIEEELAQKMLHGDVNRDDLLVFLRKHSKFHSKIEDETKRIRHHYRKEIKKLNLRFDAITRERKLLDRARSDQEKEKLEYYQHKIREMNVLLRK
jgi:hypothetical protein